MTSEKLTAKLSDGTEWKVVSNEPTAKGSENRVVWLMPLKPSPPKEVWVPYYEETPKGEDPLGSAFLSREEAASVGARVLHYTLAPEPKCMNCDKEMERIGESSKNYFCRHCVVPEDPKPAREWWEVRYRDATTTVNSFPSKERAEGFMSHFGSALDSYEIVHVREVVE